MWNRKARGVLSGKLHNDEEMSMTIIKPARMLGTTAVLVAVPLAWAVAQTQSPAPPQPSTPPSVVTPETNTPQAQKEIMPPTGSSQSKTAVPASSSSLLGLTVLSADGSKLGNVLTAKAAPDGKATAIVLKTGGFLGFGGHMVTIPAGKFTRIGDTVKVSMTADEVSKLPSTTE
jgi:sporulation protein YlmC with PRC-barrel domain